MNLDRPNGMIDVHTVYIHGQHSNLCVLSLNTENTLGLYVYTFETPNSNLVVLLGYAIYMYVVP